MSEAAYLCCTFAQSLTFHLTDYFGTSPSNRTLSDASGSRYTDTLQLPPSILQFPVHDSLPSLTPT